MDAIVWTPLNTSGWNTDLEVDKTWLDHRVDLLNDYVIPSLRNQSDKNFIWFLEIREDTIDYLQPKLNVEGVNTKFISRPIPKNRRFAWMRQPKDIEKYVTTEKFYDIRLNSDDMLIKYFIEEIRRIELNKKIQAIIPKYGYFWYKVDDVVVERHHSSPPFAALIYNTQNFLDGFRYEPRDGHSGIKEFNHITVEKKMWCWIVHEKNQKILRKGKYPSYTKYKKVEKSVLKDFGI